MIQIILMRHGRTSWNVQDRKGRRFRGLVDLPLSEEGVAQARTTAQRLAGISLTAFYSSPLQRALRTAQILAEPHGLIPRASPGLTSMDYGDWTGQFTADVAQRWPEQYRQWMHDPFSLRIPGGGSATDLRDRAVAALRAILGRHSDGETIVLVTHQVVTRTLVCVLAGMPTTAWWQFGQDLCNLSRFGYDPGSATFTLVGLNDTCHLNPMLPGRGGPGVRLIVVRHGQTAWNAGAGEERFRGRTDLPLDDTGRAQARAVAARLTSEAIVAIHASPLLRAQQTVEPLARELGLPVQPHAALLDIDYGRFQGLTHAEAGAAYPELYGLWRATPSRVAFPGGERLLDVQARLLALLDELAAHYPGQTVVLVGHQMVNKVLACTLLGLDLDQIWRVQQDTAGIDLFQQRGGAWHTLSLNDTCHLG
jgi:broad specificity phosphatase PhoE